MFVLVLKEVRLSGYQLHDGVFHLAREFAHCREQLGGLGGSGVDRFGEGDLFGHEQGREEHGNPLDVSSEEHCRSGRDGLVDVIC